MNPWEETGNLARLNLKELRAHLHNKLRINEKSASGNKKTYQIKDKDYHTYNYLVRESQKEKNPTDYDNSPGITLQLSNPLLNILSRAEERKIKRRSLEKRQLDLKKRKIEQNLEMEKMRNQKERQKHQQKLDALKQEYLRKKQMDQERSIREKQLREAMTIARDHHVKLLLRIYFAKLRKPLEIRRQKEDTALFHHTKVLLSTCMRKLKSHCADSIRKRDKFATQFWRKRILRKYLMVFIELQRRHVEAEKKAEKHFAIHLLHGVFARWQRITQDEKLLTRTKIHLARQNYQRKLLRVCFYRLRDWVRHRQGTSKQRRLKNQFRFVVKGVLPDFSPRSSDQSDEEEDETVSDDLCTSMREVAISF